ncbi:MAG: rRNA maturation RNase YbeY [Acidobacteria bacterium]|nr:MAG: rRNA maturation RNase YbeY [Acidobacteriota bacterium]
MPQIINKQRKVTVNQAELEDFLLLLTDKIKELQGRDFCVVLVSDQKIKQLNRTFRHKNSPTDVLSFPFNDESLESNFLGDVIISTETASRQASDNNLTIEKEIKQLILHGVLHLCGHDHETDNGQMNRLELRLRKILKID